MITGRRPNDPTGASRRFRIPTSVDAAALVVMVGGVDIRIWCSLLEAQYHRRDVVVLGRFGGKGRDLFFQAREDHYRR